MTWFLGDIHGQTDLIPRDRDVIQVGDMGCGFVPIPVLPNLRWLRGNHDDPAKSREHPCYIGDWKLEKGVLYLSGAGSIDKASRTEHVSWWREEELSTLQMRTVLGIENPVHTVVAHDIPLFAYGEVCGWPVRDEFATPRFLAVVAEKFRPARYIFGHHHVSKDFVMAGIHFYGLGIGELREIDVK